jgi:hypothetical protein
LNITEMCFRIKSDDSAVTSCIQDIFELPEGVAGEILACEEMTFMLAPVARQEKQILTD